MEFEELDRGVDARLALDMPKEQIEAWISQQGWTPDLYRKVATEGARGINAARVGLGQGAMMGWGDEAEAGVRSLLPEAMGGAPYDQGLKDARGGVAAFGVRNPKTATALQLGGAMVPALATLGAAAPASITGAIGQGALIGGVGGAITGAGTADGSMAERLRGAAVGALAGGGLGGAASGLLGGLAGAARGMRDRPAALAQRSLLDDGRLPPSTLDPADVAAAQRGKPLTLAELSGEAATKRLDAAMTRATDEGAGVADFLKGRQAKAFERIQDDLFDFLPEAAAGTTRKQAREAVDQARPLIQQAYQDAYQVPVDQMPQTLAAFDEIAGTPLGKEAWKKAKTLALNDGAKIGDGPPDMRTVDYFKRALDDVIDKNVVVDMATNRPKVTQIGRQGQMMKRRLLEAADAENPDYGRARGLATDTEQMKRMMEMGKRIGEKRVEAADLADDMALMAPEEQMAYRVGAVRRLLADVGGASGEMVDRAKGMLSPSMRAKLQAIEPTPGAADKLLEALSIESEMTKTTQKLMANSRTASRAANLQEIDEGAITNFVSGGVPTTSGGLLDRVFGAAVRGWANARQAGVMKSTAAGLAKRLGSNDPAEISAVLREIQGLSASSRYPRLGPVALPTGSAAGGLLQD